MGEKFFLFDKLFLPGHNNPRVVFQFGKTEQNHFSISDYDLYFREK